MSVDEQAPGQSSNTAKEDGGSDRYQGSAENLEALRPKLLALRDVRRFTLYVPRARRAGICNWESYTRDKDLFAAGVTSKHFDAIALLDYPNRIGVLCYLHDALEKLREPTGVAPALLSEARGVYAVLDRTARYLLETHPTLGQRLKTVRRRSGPRGMAEALSQYALLFDEHWDQVRRNTTISRKHVGAARLISAEMMAALGGNEKDELDAIKDLRNRAAEYLILGTQQIRWAAKFIFGNSPEVMKRYPSLYFNGQSGRRGAATDKKVKRHDACPARRDDKGLVSPDSKRRSAPAEPGDAMAQTMPPPCP